MIGYRLCNTKKAKCPFFVESISVNLYSLEELCFFIQKNLALVDRNLISLELVRWVAEELELGETALKMERALRKEEDIAEFILPLYQDTRYLDASEISALQKALDGVSTGPLWLRMKKKADALLQNEKYSEALRIYYDAIRECDDLKNRDNIREFQASVWHNIGVADLQLFEYEEGTEAFYKSAKLSATKEHIRAYLKALKLTLPSEKYKDRIAELMEEENWEVDDNYLMDINDEVDLCLKEKYPYEITDLKKTLSRAVSEFHASAGL